MGRPAALSKTAFVQRVAAWAGRYFITFDSSRLNEWIKQGLALKAEPGPSKGRRRTYTYSYVHYRRALQLVRFYRYGVKDTDAILVQLFIRGYSVEPHEVREALKKEFIKARAKLNSVIRSAYADSDDAIPAVRKEQLRRQLGEQDERLRKTGIVPPDDFVISALRAARDPSGVVAGRNAKSDSFQPIYNIITYFMSDMLAEDDEFSSKMEKIIARSGSREYQQARSAFQCVRKLFGIMSSSNQPHLAEASNAIYDSLPTREFTAIFLTLSLKLVANDTN
jgi:hypothetical protein